METRRKGSSFPSSTKSNQRHHFEQQKMRLGPKSTPRSDISATERLPCSGIEIGGQNRIRTGTIQGIQLEKIEISASDPKCHTGRLHPPHYARGRPDLDPSSPPGIAIPVRTPPTSRVEPRNATSRRTRGRSVTAKHALQNRCRVR